MVVRWPTLIIASCISLAWGCSKEQNKEQPKAEASSAAASQAAVKGPDAATEAKKLFQGRCVVCHGDHGAGDGPGSAAINPKPRAFSDTEWQKSVTDEHLEKVILSGGAAVGKSPLMPGNPDLKDKPEVLEALVKVVRGFEQ